MRVAIAGSHCTGKSSLCDALMRRLKGYVLVEEPYVQMIDEGYEFSDPPTAEEFRDQLQRYVASTLESGPETLFERSPVDFLAYAMAKRRGEPDALDAWLELCREGLERLDAIVFCPIEEPDRMRVPRGEHPGLRRRVDDALRELLEEDRFDLMGETTFVEVQGDLATRLDQTLRLFERVRVG